ncbi:MAG: D-2-hydroxyacid dehydrogenase [Firmicutes bacterium]|nr:D-2-hydroxyacid dehydrogenase [Bacillota bacterium]
MIVTTYLPSDLEHAFLQELAERGFDARIVPWSHTTAADRTQSEILVGWYVPQEVIDALPNLTWLQVAGAGVDWTLDLRIADAVAVTRMVEGFGTDMAEFALMAALAWVKDWSRLRTLQQQRRWDPYLVRTLASLTVGVLGAGAIGQTIAKTFQPLVKEIRIMGRSRPQVPHIAGYRIDEASAFYRDLDLLIIVVPLTPDTRSLVGESAFSLMREGGYVINLARGAVIDTSALIAAVTRQQLSGAFLDVFETEPLPPDAELWSIPGITVSPHMAGITRAEVLAAHFMANFRRFRRQEPLIGMVDRTRGY